VSRSHNLFQVFAADSPARDLVVLGNFDIALKDGNNVRFDFTARFIVVPGEGEQQAAFRLAQVWTDPTDMIAAFKKATETLAAQD